jgi:hypothetical protein
LCNQYYDVCYIRLIGEGIFLLFVREQRTFAISV